MKTYPHYDFPTEQLRNEFRFLVKFTTMDRDVPFRNQMRAFSFEYGVPLEWVTFDLNQNPRFLEVVSEVLRRYNVNVDDDEERLQVYQLGFDIYLATDRHILAGFKPTTQRRNAFNTELFDYILIGAGHCDLINELTHHVEALKKETHNA